MPSLRRRPLTGMVGSGWAVLALLLIGMAALGAGIRALSAQYDRLAVDDVIRTGRVAAALTADRAASENVPMRSLTAVTYADLRRDVQALQRHQDVVGIRLWTTGGQLLFSYPESIHQQATPDGYSAALRGEAHVNLGHTVIYGTPVDVVLLPVEPDGDGRPEGIVEVLLPHRTLAGQQRGARNVIYTGAGIMYALLASFLVAAHVTSRRRIRAALQDPLTGLGNRAGLERDAGGLLDRGALLLLDLDGFKAVNDSLGHHAGDELLVQVATGLRHAVRPQDVVVRLGGDEFAVFLADAEELADAHAAAARIRRTMAGEGYEVAGVTLAVDASIGIALAPRHGADVGALQQAADVAMYSAKSRGSGVEVYDHTMDPYDADQLAVLGDLRRALAENELVLHYQPKARLQDGHVVGAEALIRWNHPTRGLLPPAAFIPLAEHTSLMWPLTQWVIDTAIRQAAQWRKASDIDLVVSVNVSPRSLGDELLTFVLASTQHHGLPPELLEIEVTETAIMADPERAVLVLRRLHDLGIRISLDDFGAGYTGLSYLTGLPVDTIKIDRGFISQIAEDDGHDAVGAAVIELGHRLDMAVLAEGVERQATRDRLVALGCDEMQGFLLARPAPAEEFEQWLAVSRLSPLTPTLPATH